MESILVVRGSLSNPETYRVNLRKILAGQAQDFPLMPKDIVYVCDRPWSKVEELSKAALMAFVGAASSSWMSTNIPPILKNSSTTSE